MANYFGIMTCILASFAVVFARKEPSNLPLTQPPVRSWLPFMPLATPPISVVPAPPIPVVMPPLPPIVIPTPPPSSPIVIPVPPTPPVVIPGPPTSASPPDYSDTNSPSPSPSEEEGPSPGNGASSGANCMSSSFNFVQLFSLVFACIPFLVLA